MAESQKKINKERASFEKARYEYCVALYEKETKRNAGLETRIQFYFSFITLVLGAIFLKFDFFEKVKDLFAHNKVPIFISYILLISIAILGLSLLVSAFSILAFARLRTYIRTYPDNLVTALFAPNTQYLRAKTEEDFYEATAMSCALALESNVRVTDQQVKWVQMCSVSTYLIVLSLFIILSVSAYLLIVS